MQDLFYVLLFLGIALIGTVTVLLYYIFIQKPEIKRERRVNRKKILECLQNPKLTRIEVEKIARTLGIEEYSVRDILLDLHRIGKLSGLLVFPNLYFDIQYCIDTIFSLAKKRSSNEIPLKLIADEFDTTKHNIHKILVELITSYGLQGVIDFNNEIFILQKEKIERKTLTCPFCNGEISSLTENCPQCGVKLERCGVCNLIIGKEESINCPFCGQPSHRDHLSEWLRIKGKCPVCKHKLNEELLEEDLE